MNGQQFSPTHRVVATGSSTGQEPGLVDGPRLDPQLEVELQVAQGQWVLVRCSNDWAAWVPALSLEPLPTRDLAPSSAPGDPVTSANPVPSGVLRSAAPRRARWPVLAVLAVVAVVAVGFAVTRSQNDKTTVASKLSTTVQPTFAPTTFSVETQPPSTFTEQTEPASTATASTSPSTSANPSTIEATTIPLTLAKGLGVPAGWRKSADGFSAAETAADVDAKVPAGPRVRGRLVGAEPLDLPAEVAATGTNEVELIDSPRVVNIDGRPALVTELIETDDNVTMHRLYVVVRENEAAATSFVLEATPAVWDAGAGAMLLGIIGCKPEGC